MNWLKSSMSLENYTALQDKFSLRLLTIPRPQKSFMYIKENDSNIQNGSYELVKVQIPAQFANAPKGISVRLTQKSNPFGIHKNFPDINFNVFNTLSDKQISSMYATRRFLKPNYLSKRITPLLTNSEIVADNGIIQKTVFVGPNETKNNLSIAVNYLKNGQFPRKNSTLKLDKQTYSLVVQFIENK